jgi:hypothetical protein
MGMYDPSIMPMMCRIPCKVSNFFDKTLNWGSFENCTNNFWRCNLTVWQNSLTITKIVLLETLKISHYFKPFPFPNHIKDIATLSSTKIGSFIVVCCILKCGPNFSQRYQNVPWKTLVLCLNMFFV